MKILYLHGLGAQPGGLKPTFLEECGHAVVNPALPDEQFEESVNIAHRALAESRPDLVVGSSRGGAVAVNMNTGEVPIVLVAPAWKKWGSATTCRAVRAIVHSLHDDVVSIEDSRELLANSGLPQDRLIVVGEDHFMADRPALAALESAVAAANLV